MKAEIYSWIKNLAVFYILLTTVVHLVPDKKYERYVRLFMGLLLIFMLITPVFALLGKGEKLLADFQLYYEEETAVMKEKELSNLQEIYLKKGWQWEIEEKIRDSLKEKGIYPGEVEVDIEEEEARAVLYMEELPGESEKGRIESGMEVCGFKKGTFEIRTFEHEPAAVGGSASYGTSAGGGSSSGIS
ncbi:MAG: stage III sporulation protein AF [Clostridiales bacterium]|nr:stage III sporulation protein AF [Clostridiales bacterium]